MKIIVTLALTAGLLLSLSGCAIPSAKSTPLHAGFLYADMKYSGDYPDNANNGAPGPRRGEASMDEILWVVSSGDASITAAAKSAGITKISTVEHEFVNVLCLYQKYTTIVTGE